MQQKAGVIVTIDPFSGTKERYGQLYAALAKLGPTGTFFGPEVSISNSVLPQTLPLHVVGLALT